MADPTKIIPELIRQRRAREDLNVFSRLPAVYAASRKQGQQFLRAGGKLSIVEWRTLWDLFEAGPMTIRDLAAIQRADHSLLSRALPDMRKKGYVTMTQDMTDKRQTVVEITAEGRAAYERVAPIMARRRAALREVMSDEDIRTFIELLNKVEAFLQIPAAKLIEEESAQ